MNLNIKKKPRLGRGLSSLISMPVPVEPPASPVEADAAEPQAVPTIVAEADDTQAAMTEGLAWVEVGRITPNPYQPRKSFDPATLEQLAASIRQDGVMQPIVVRRSPGGANEQGGEADYQLIAGERRWRAAQLAGLTRVPAVVRDLDERQVAEWAVIENMQREDLNPLDRADALARLANLFQMTHQQIADRLGLDRTTVTNLLRLIELHPEIQEMVRRGTLSGGHGRALLGLLDHDAQLVLARKAVAGGWSVRTIEAAVRKISEPLADANTDAPASKPVGARAALLDDLEQQLANQLGTKVHIKPARKKNAGTLHIEYYDLDQFEGLLQRLGIQLHRD